MSRPTTIQSARVERIVAQVIERSGPELTRVARLWTRKAQAARLSVSEPWIDTWRAGGLLPAIVLHADPADRDLVLYREEEVIRFLRARGIEPAEDAP